MSPKLIKRATILDKSAVPEREVVLHRRGQIEDVLQVLRAGLITSGSNAYLIGPPGTGKTTVSKLSVRRLREDEHVDVAFVEGHQHHTQHQILTEVAKQIAGVVRNNLSSSDLTDALEEDTEVPRVVVIDEADQVDDKSVFGTLSELPNLSLIFVANGEQDLFRGVEGRLYSRISTGRTIAFEGYSVRELAEILGKRAEYGLRDGCVDKQTLERIAQFSGGDARIAIETLATAAAMAENSQSRRIKNSHVDDAIPKARETLWDELLSKLNDHQLAALHVIEQAGEISMGKLHPRYADRADDSVGEERLRQYLAKMEHYRAITVTGDTKARKYSAVDWKAEILSQMKI